MPDNSPRYLFVSNYFPPPFIGGSVVYVHFVHAAFGREAIVLAPTQLEAHAHDANCPYVVLRLDCALPSEAVTSRWRRILNGITLFFKVLLLVKRLNIKVLHVGNLGKLALTAYIVAWLTGVKTVITLHGEELSTRPGRGALCWGWPGRGINALLYFCARRLDLVIASSPTTEGLLHKMHFNRERIVVITPGLDESKMPSADLGHGEAKVLNADFALAMMSRPRALSENLSLSPMLLCLGRLISRKGQDVLLQALPRVLQEFPTAHLVLAGCGPDEGKLRAIIERLNLASNVSLLTQVSNPESAWLYAHCTVFCMPNRTLPNGDSEGYGIVFLEAGAWSKPVIGGRAGGAVDAVDDGITGLLVDSQDAKAVAAGILQLLNNPDLCQRMGQAGRQKALLNGWQAKSEQFKGLVERLGEY